MRLKVSLQGLSLKMGEATGGETPNINSHFNVVFNKEGQKFFKGSNACPQSIDDIPFLRIWI